MNTKGSSLHNKAANSETHLAEVMAKRKATLMGAKGVCKEMTEPGLYPMDVQLELCSILYPVQRIFTKN